MVNINVEEGRRYYIFNIGPTFAVGVHRQYITTSSMGAEKYTTVQTIIMLPFMNLTIQKFRIPKD